MLALIGGGLALLAGLGIAVGLVSKGKGEKAEPPPASQAGLVVDASAIDDGLVDSTRPLRCFVAGLYVGEVTLVECAKKNGVATGALDVGVDASGNLAAADQAGTVLTPLPPAQSNPPSAPVPPQAPSAPVAASAPAPQQVSAPAGACWRYGDNSWVKLPADLTLNACAQTLFAGRCEKPGGAVYGRWMSQTLRLVPGRVEVSGDNRSFHSLAEQGPGCSLPNIG